MEPITLAIAPERHQTRLLMMCGQSELLKAILGPPSTAHPRAAKALLEGLALWHQKTLSVVLSVDAEELPSDWGLCDQLGYGERNIHYDVTMAMRDPRVHRRTRMAGFGHFRKLQRLCLERGLV